ncbi:IclR family transcriptional regulator domain-containing protein [Roseomonas xinghualingensis]|uniref:IclR family transcriptional regulator domain-containing protein n=1 Tax=Roseomonas xinghualingensis TaxID=2986475 RepID=UPI0021F0BD26|nr:helix-turn-helix domain-containing protein [Roseomonas sp. SXEYE001]MCV4207201.1 helix-turn-helix domain-containing protein [Roseomonas sp. SXEYE001]
MPSYEPVTALMRGLEVLRAVNRLPAAGVKDIHRLTGINQPTIVRMLETLMHAGFVIRHPQQPVYLPTGKTLELSSGYVLHREIGILATPVMTRLRGLVGWPSDVAIFDGDAMVVAHTSRGEGRFIFDRRTGFRAPVFATSLGRAYLAFCGEADRERAFSLAARSPEPWNTLAHRPAEAAAAFAAIRATGYAVMDEAYSDREYGGQASAVAVPVLVGGLAAASLNLMYLRETIERAAVVDRLLPLLREAASELGAAVEGLGRSA